MKRGCGPAVVAVMLAVFGAMFVGGAAALTPPAPTPDLSRMTVQPSDLQPGAQVGTDGYQTTPAGFTALYERDFTAARTTPGGLSFQLRTQILLAPSAALARREVRAERTLFGSARGRRLLIAAILAGSGGRLNPKEVHFGKITPLGVSGSGSFELRVTVREAARVATATFTFLGAGPVAASVVVIARAAQVPRQIVSTLVSDIVGHVASVLAGSTGASGATGAT